MNRSALFVATIIICCLGPVIPVYGQSSAVQQKDSGGYAFNAAKILGALSAAALSNTYNPPTNRGPSTGETFSRAGISVGSDAAFNIFKEFWPDFARKIKLNVWIENLVRSTIRDVNRVD